MNPLASIVIPAYNATSFLPDAISSAQAQTLQNIEIVVVDDGSTDSTWKIIVAAAEKDRRIVPVRRSRRGGPSAACNEGFRKAQGRWIALLDADDLFLPQRVERLVSIAEDRGADLLADDLLERNFETGADLGRHFGETVMRTEAPLTLKEMLRRDMPHLSSKLGYVQPIKRKAFLDRTGVCFAEDIGGGEDFLFYFECVARGARFHLTPEAYYIYRIRQGSVSTSKPMRHFVSQANRRKMEIAAGCNDPEIHRLLHTRQRALDLNNLRWAAHEGRYREALSYVQIKSPLHLLRQVGCAVKAAHRGRTARKAVVSSRTSNPVQVQGS
jgi:glycosyltransferase involved in cell wall biosynthesis